jgi:hypothetical protein
LQREVGQEVGEQELPEHCQIQKPGIRR